MILRLAMAPALLALWAAAQTAPNAGGHWQGKIAIPDRELAITVDLARNEKGAWIGSMSVTGSTSVDVPLSGIAADGGAVKFTASLPMRSAFDGRFSADGNSIAGTASSSMGEAPFSLTRSGEAKVAVPAGSSALAKDFEGNWEGTIDAGGTARRIVMKLSSGADGKATGVLIAVDQGGLEIPVDTVTIRDKQLDLEARAVSGTYRGTLGEGGQITGEWTQRGTHTAVNFKRAAGK